MDNEILMAAIKDILGTDRSKQTDNERIQSFITALMNCPVNMTLNLRDVFREVATLKEGAPVQALKVKRGRPGLKRTCISFSGSMYFDDWVEVDKIVAEVKRDTKQPVTRMSVYRAIIEVGVKHRDELEIDLG